MAKAIARSVCKVSLVLCRFCLKTNPVRSALYAWWGVCVQVAELRSCKLGALRKRALGAGVDDDELDKALDSVRCMPCPLYRTNDTSRVCIDTYYRGCSNIPSHHPGIPLPNISCTNRSTK